MFIVHLSAPQSTTGGDFVYRVRQPDAALARISDVTTVSLTNICSRRRELLLGADLLVVQMLADPDLLDVVAVRRRYGRPTVYEVSDNFMAFQDANPVAGFYNAPENKAIILQLVSCCDAVQVSMPMLADICRPYCKRVEAFPNQIVRTQWVERKAGPMVVGWGGSIGHLEDMKQTAPFLVEWLNRNEDVRFMLMGDEQFVPLFKGLSPEQFEFVPSGTLDDYFSFLTRIDVGIAPLSDHPFNSGRSDGKFIEYASRCVVPVCSDLPAYKLSVRHGETGFLFNSGQALVQTLEVLRQNPELRRRISTSAYRYVSQHRTEDVGARKRYAFYRSLVPIGCEAGTLNTSVLESIPQLRQADSPRHFLHEFSRSEQAAYEGLIYEFNWKDSGRARASYERAIELEPTFFQARYYFGNFLISSDPALAVGQLQQALALEPNSAHAAYLLARSLRGCGQEEYALAAVRALQCSHPEYASGFELEAEILISRGRDDEAVSPLRQSLQVNPFYSPALIRLGVLWLNMERPVEAEQVFRLALELVPNSARIHWGLAVALHSQGRESEALDKCIDAIRIDSSGTPAVDALISTAAHYVRSEKTIEAVEVLSKGLEVAPSHPDLLLWRRRIMEASAVPNP